MQRASLFKAKYSMLLLQLEMLKVCTIYEVEPVCTHVVRVKEYWHENPRLNVAQSAAELDDGLIGRDLFLAIIEE